ncbi:Glu-tRNA(Gln) amidotransferase subunit GatE [archaeon]|jgi:Glu-tRNA(Gln) amidotransferase subunit E-like FAD-binding protein|nr:Glu-tRNA(Gln) amidotransferase subunit GatE [archaeon]MBT4373802.1 Glu-tRNA(Gln) amidotransferase subunit GatE [archaeon]MBT4532268.1 Glu-tRNA(Gln) amidotransferase subunit GatE [archaeon]MBT7001093.1 Glu-tRNA(Gln) amidotransferase subunit GatE [archaeon]MBT7281982.1 Glu-tRNA(Gln) amidotransferase subunit GatE [archaeon]
MAIAPKGVLRNMSKEIFTKGNYEKLKFKSGLEIHQQLDTGKLFCNCPSVLRKGEPDFEVKRNLHAVAGESGEVDVAALYQTFLKKDFVYQGYDENTCLVELDEEPPHEINKDALKIAVQIALLMNMKIFPITQIMRKTVIDGSNTSGFQRTAMIARDGFVETSFGKVKIEALFLEEDSARNLKREKTVEIYKLDRLGIPLVEVVTAPEIKNAEHAKEVALKIGEILRSCKVRRGIGTIRQDVNVSIRGENRVEIKGMQNMDTFVKGIENEILRQEELSDAGKPVENEVRNILPDAKTEFLRPLPGSSRMYPETDLPLLKISRDFINDAKKTLPKLRGELEGELKSRGLNEEMIKLLFKRRKVNEFKDLLSVYNQTDFLAKLILMFPKEIAKKEKLALEKVEEIFEDNYVSILNALEKNKISEGDVKDVLVSLVKGEDFEKAIKIERVDVGDVEERIIKLINENPGLRPNAYMGLVMKEFGGKINGGEVMEIIGKYLK